MEPLSSSSSSSSATTVFNLTPNYVINLRKSPHLSSTLTFPFSLPTTKKNRLLSISHSSSFFPRISSLSTRINSTLTSTTLTPSISSGSSSDYRHHYMVLVEAPPQGANSKPEIINYYVKTLETVLGSEKDAQQCIYDASTDAPFGFCCDIDEDTSQKLAGVVGVLSVRPDPDFNAIKKDYTLQIQMDSPSSSHIGSNNLFPTGKSKHWLVKMDKPMVAVVTKAQMVDHYVQILAKVMGNETDAQMCIYHISWQSDFGFCCELDEESARELAGVPGVLSVQPDENFESQNKNYGGSLDSSEGSETIDIKTKKLFVTGLSFYTSEKTLRAAFESFGELVEVKIIMDKISKRSKGYAFLEYTTEEAASAALKEMNNKIINGWMIVVDVAKTNPAKYSRGRPISRA